MKVLGKIFFFLVLINSASAQQKPESFPKIYDAIISFNSICCGTPSSAFLSNFLQDFNRKNKVALKVWHIGSCGREGEFKILVSELKLNKSKQIKFKKRLQILISDQNNKNKTLKPSSGTINIEYNIPLSNEENCLEKLSEWKF